MSGRETPEWAGTASRSGRLALVVLAVLCCSLSVAEAQRSRFIFEHPFIVASRTGDLAAVRDYLARGDSPDLKDNAGQTPLIIATFNGFIDIAEEIIGASTALDAKDNEGNTALHWAVIQDQLEISRMLLTAGATPNVPNRQGLTPLMQAAKDGRLLHLELMMRHGPNLTLRDYTGRSALGWARQSRDRRVELLLRQVGAQE